MPKLKTGKTIQPEIYCFTTPGVEYHDGWCKIGYTDSKSAWDRVYEESRTPDVYCDIKWHHRACFDTSDGCRDPFTDKNFHEYLDSLNIPRKESVYKNSQAPEYYKITPEEAEKLFFEFQRGTFETLHKYKLRKEQQDAVELMNCSNEVLLNAKPRFGKTLTTYDYIKTNGFKKALILTNRPVVATSWYKDYLKFLGFKNYVFVSNCYAVQEYTHCISREDYLRDIDKYKDKVLIEFVSLQDLKGSVYFGGTYNKLREISEYEWDVVIIDESHEAVDTSKSQFALDRISRKNTVYLSGTPFKAIASDKFSNVYNWTYVDEQSKKSSSEQNDYSDLPTLNLYTYNLADMFVDETTAMEDDIDREKYFDLNLFFRSKNKQFLNDKDVSHFLDMITSEEKYPFSSEENRNQLKHTIWLFDRVDSAKAMYNKLKSHPIFKDYEIVNVAGNIKDEAVELQDEDFQSAYDKVTNAIKKYDKTITLSVGRLTMGVTIPEWTGIMMCCNVASPELYIQAIFRTQNPGFIQEDNGEYVKKENAYVFDFDPARTLTILEQYANNLYSATVNGKGTFEERLDNITKLLTYLPVVGENDNGELVSYCANDVVTIPIKTHAYEIVKHGFMSNFLFQNLTRIFNDPRAKEILDNIKDIRGTVRKDEQLVNSAAVDKDGNPAVDQQKINDNSQKMSADISQAIPQSDSHQAAQEASKIVESPTNKIENPTDKLRASKNEMDSPTSPEILKEQQKALDQFIKERTDKFIKEIIPIVKAYYPDADIAAVKKAIAKRYKEDVDKAKKVFDTDLTTLKIQESERRHSVPASEKNNIVREYNDKYNELTNDFENIVEEIEDNLKKADGIISTFVDNAERERQRKINEKAENDWLRVKLRMFARSIPSFLMAYNVNDCTQLTKEVNAAEFKELTGIDVEDYNYFVEHDFFNKITFNNAIREFYNLRDRLSNYFEDTDEDIFDYIPPQKTNQIFTPKRVVKEMVDFLVDNDPTCFDDPEHTFIDPYMKSGLYITEIVKRLYNNENIKRVYPNDEERLKHIFDKQVYGLAPTEILYRITTNFIFGFDKEHEYNHSHFACLDANQYVHGQLEAKLDEIFGEQ